MSKICLVILSPDNVPLERFVFDVSGFPEIPLAEINTPFVVDDSESSGTREANLEEQYRAVLRKLSFSAPKLGKLPDNCSFSLAIELREDVSPPEGVFDANRMNS